MALNNLRMQTPTVQRLAPEIAVVGVGGGGGNAVRNMIEAAMDCKFVVCNSDAQALESSPSANKVQLGAHVTGGLGAGSKPEIGRAAAEESLEEVMKHIDGANMVFITAGMGGGTGTGAAPVIAKACRERGILTVGVVTKPFHFEGSHRMKMAEAGIKEMQNFVDTLIIPNQNLFRVANEKTTFAEAFRLADGVLQSGVSGVIDLIVRPGLVNLDFADIRTAMMEMGKAMMGTGEATGDKRAIEAAERAINNPLLDDISMKGARGVIINVSGGYDMTLFEADEACNRIRDEVDPDANIIFGATFNENLEGVMRVSIVATGIDREAIATRRSGGSEAKVDAKGKPMLERAQPRTDLPAAATAPSPVFVPAAHSRPFAAPPALAAQNTMRTQPALQQPMQQQPAPVQVSARAADPDLDLFEQREFAAAEQADVPQNTAMRGARYKDLFIPPPPAMAQTDEAAYEVAPRASGLGIGSGAPQQQYHTTGGGLQLNPPRLPNPQQQRKRPPSLFERISNTVLDNFRDGPADHYHQPTERAVPAAPSYSDNGGGQLAAMAARPAQGMLNIDAPAARPRSVAEEEMVDIPAFLRRQAN